MDLEWIQVGPVKVALMAHDDRIVRHIREKKKPFEPKSLAAWASMCEKGKTALDIGGYSGLFAIAAAKLGCKAWCFEPMPLNLNRIRMNAIHNNVKFEIIGGVVSDVVGTLNLTWNDKVVGLTAGASLVRKKGYKMPVPSVTVDSMCLDDVCAIKIDVERGEPAVLRGARQTITRCRPGLIVEALGQSERSAVEEILPDYVVWNVMDVRNLLMVDRLPTKC